MKPIRHVQVFGAVQTPPFKHFCLQTASIEIQTKFIRKTTTKLERKNQQQHLKRFNSSYRLDNVKKHI